MKTSPKSLVTFVAFVLVIGGFTVFNLVLPKPEIILNERRQPAEMPNLTVDALLSTSFMDEFENYAVDNFTLREQLRTVRAATVFYGFWMSDKDGLYLGTAGGGEIKPVNPKGVLRWASMMEQIHRDLSSTARDLSFYYAIIPDKSLYDTRPLPGYDPQVIRELLDGRLIGVTAIDLTGALTATDFYLTDIHWDQAELGQRSDDVLGTLAQAIAFEGRLERSFVVTEAGPFSGVYSGQLALPLRSDRLKVLTSPSIDQARAFYLDPRTGGYVAGPVYDLEAIHDLDAYNIFLRGAQPVVVLENPASETDRELYIFRDSFTSSLAPLLISAYAKITLIDLRYIDYRILQDHVSFAERSDVLFLYGSQILNDPSTLLVRIPG